MKFSWGKEYLVNLTIIVMFSLMIWWYNGVGNLRYIVVIFCLLELPFFYKLVKSKESLLLLAFFVISALGLYFNDLGIAKSVRVLNWYLAFLLGAFFGYYSKKTTINIAIYGYIISYLLLFLVHWKIGGGVGYVDGRYVGIQPSYNAKGELVGIGIIFLVFSIVKAFETKSFYMVGLNILLIILSVPIIIETGSRTAFFITVFMCVMVFFMEYKNKKISWMAAGVIFLIVIALYFSKVGENRIFKNIQNPLSVASFQSRLPIFNAAWECFKEKPFLGYGFTNYEMCFSKHQQDMTKKYEIVEETAPNAHNIFLQFLSETGILGFLPIILFIIFTLINGFKKFRFGFYVLLAMSLYFLMNMNLYLRVISMLFFIFSGMCLSYANLEKYRKDQE